MRPVIPDCCSGNSGLLLWTDILIPLAGFFVSSVGATNQELALDIYNATPRIVTAATNPVVCRGHPLPVVRIRSAHPANRDRLTVAA